jgi:pimeloyl-ACP methyl ester carboxylesterase
MARPTDLGLAVELPGPWRHRHVAANGARFHVAECAPADVGAAAVEAVDPPLVLLLHGFPGFWWSWRAQLPALAAAGYRTVAMDLRGYGGSDKTPRGYDPFTLAQDVAGVVKALGGRRAVLVGHGWGGYVAWATAMLQPREVRAVAAVAAPHPRVMLTPRVLLHGDGALRHVLAMQLPLRPERRLANPRSGFLREHLAGWSAPGSAFPSPEAVTTYQQAISLWPASHCALEYHRWLLRSRFRSDGRRFSRAMATPVPQPVLVVAGGQDPAVPVASVVASRRRVSGPITSRVVTGAGHFVPEEAPEQLTGIVRTWLDGLPADR